MNENTTVAAVSSDRTLLPQYYPLNCPCCVVYPITIPYVSCNIVVEDRHDQHCDLMQDMQVSLHVQANTHFKASISLDHVQLTKCVMALIQHCPVNNNTTTAITCAKVFPQALLSFSGFPVALHNMYKAVIQSKYCHNWICP